MSFFKNIFGGAENQKESDTIKIDWEPLNFIGQLDEIVTLSKTKPVAIFKHSTRCSISRMALKQFENEFDSSEQVTPYFLDLITFREISNQIASRFNVQHQSPQLILIKNGKATYHVSHSDISALDLKSKL